MRCECSSQRSVPDELAVRAHDLSVLGINELAWEWPDVLEVLDFCLANSLTVLGGDVYPINEGSAGYSPDGWSTSWAHDEGSTSLHEKWCSYVRKSVQKSKDYIAPYRERNGFAFCFTVVFVTMQRYVILSNGEL